MIVCVKVNCCFVYRQRITQKLIHRTNVQLDRGYAIMHSDVWRTKCIYNLSNGPMRERLALTLHNADWVSDTIITVLIHWGGFCTALPSVLSFAVTI